MVHLRLATEEDSDSIIGFQLLMAKESEGIDLNRDTLKDGVLAVFRDPQKGKYFVAEDNGKIVGSLLTTYEWSDWRNQWVFWMQSVYILTAYRGKGIFRIMFQQLIEQVENEENVAGIRLYVDVSNKNAIGVYNSIGMDGEHYKVFEWMNE